MKRLLPLVIILFLCTFLVFSFTGCSKESEDRLAAACDTTAVKYSTGVLPILQNNCYPCHGASSNSGSGGITLEGYNNIKAYVNQGYVVGNVTHAPGFVAMPYGLPKLPDCEVNTIVAWVHQGALNN